MYRIDKRNDLFEQDFWLQIWSFPANHLDFLKYPENEIVLQNSPFMIDFVNWAQIFSVAIKKKND